MRCNNLVIVENDMLEELSTEDERQMKKSCLYSRMMMMLSTDD